ncbi:MAG: cysteine--tRNA ligase [Oscillospiraceae bacterium]|jgi:cysteinyl-tRNA synthetase|nr:cysteine--tRNA ligase [Oscillospiraceae bacterium]
MKLHNTMTMKKEELIPIEPGRVRIYACGPTVYNLIHIGNARPIIVFDALRRYLEYRGYEVKFVQNFTDIDDKIINRAAEEGVSSAEIAEKYITEYFTDARALGVRDANVHPRATETVDDIIALITTLIDGGKAYVSDGDVYFRVDSFPEYGKLSHQPRDALLAGARVDVSEIKENPMDFALWKASKPGEPFWESPWGRGRPGWHIECSAMNNKIFGPTLDIHCGGQDIMFPHHENEIAQSESASGQPFAHCWLHNGMITVDGKKMSKSLGNFFTVRDAAEAYGYENIRMFMLMSHYRSPINYSGEILMQAKAALERIKTARERLLFISESGAEAGADDGSGSADIDFARYRERFAEALDDDFNTADAISVIFELVREVNTAVSAPQDARAALDALDELVNVLGLIYGDKADSTDADAEKIDALISERAEARATKNWARADEIRDILNELGVVVEDTPQGARWKRG